MEACYQLNGWILFVVYALPLPQALLTGIRWCSQEVSYFCWHAFFFIVSLIEAFRNGRGGNCLHQQAATDKLGQNPHPSLRAEEEKPCLL
jgi:hypothetical protein